MGDIAPCIINRRLSDILIPGSHDSATYGMSAAAKTQSLDLYNQLDAGARQFDIRVEWNHNVPADQQGYYAHHGDPGKLDEISNTLSLANIFTQLGQWADAGSDALNHGQEIILVSLVFAPGAGFPADECNTLHNNVNIVTPDMLHAHFGTTDPGEVTFGQLWSLPKQPGLENVSRVIMDDNVGCAGGTMQWGPFSPQPPQAYQTQTLFSGYYADQCYADAGDAGDGNGTLSWVPLAAQSRATWGAGDNPIGIGPSKVGGLYVLGIQSTPRVWPPYCRKTPEAMQSDQQQVLTELINLWNDPDGNVRDYLNIVQGDFIGNWLWEPLVNMNVVPTPPDPPTIKSITTGSGQVTVELSAPADHGTGPVTSHTVTAVDPSGRQEGSATGTSSPITVTGLTNGQQYQFRMTATNAAGEGKPSAWSDPVTVGGSPPTLDDGPAHTGFVGHPYLSSFAVRGMQGSRVTLESGMIPPGLTLGQDGTLEGTATRAGEYKFGVRATNRFGYHRGVATVTISETGAPHPETSWQHVRAKICTTGASDGPECATRSLFGPFAGLEGRAAARLVRGPVTYATGHGHATAGDRGLTLRRRCEPPLEERRCEPPPAGRYTLELLRPDHRSIFVPVTLH